MESHSSRRTLTSLLLVVSPCDAACSAAVTTSSVLSYQFPVGGLRLCFRHQVVEVVCSWPSILRRVCSWAARASKAGHAAAAFIVEWLACKSAKETVLVGSCGVEAERGLSFLSLVVWLLAEGTDRESKRAVIARVKERRALAASSRRKEWMDALLEDLPRLTVATYAVVSREPELAKFFVRHVRNGNVNVRRRSGRGDGRQ